MKAYLDSEDSYYRYNEESIKEELINVKVKSKKDYAGIGAIIFTFTVLSIVIGLSIFTAWQIVYGQDLIINTTNSNRTVLTLEQYSALNGRIIDFQKLLNYCFLHADRPNPIQDLVDKGLIDAKFSGKTCNDIKLNVQEANNLLINSDINATKQLETKKDMLRDRLDKQQEKQKEAVRESRKWVI